MYISSQTCTRGNRNVHLLSGMYTIVISESDYNPGKTDDKGSND